MTLRNLFYCLGYSTLLVSPTFFSTANILQEEKVTVHGFRSNSCKERAKCKINNCKKVRGHRGATGATGATGLTGPAGATGASGTNTQSYGRLSLATATTLPISTALQWYAIPFDTFNPSSNMAGTTSSPATITIQESGIYKINVNLYFSSFNSEEDTFNQATYTLGISLNGAMPITQAAVFAGEPGHFSINYSDLVQLNTDDYIQFYIQSSIVGNSIEYDNLVTLEQGNAYLLQIGN